MGTMHCHARNSCCPVVHALCCACFRTREVVSDSESIFSSHTGQGQVSQGEGLPRIRIRGQWMVDPHGLVVIFHSFNSVLKGSSLVRRQHHEQDSPPVLQRLGLQRRAPGCHVVGSGTHGETDQRHASRRAGDLEDSPEAENPRDVHRNRHASRHSIFQVRSTRLRWLSQVGH